MSYRDDCHLTEGGVHQLPIVDEQSKLVGLVTRIRLIAALFHGMTVALLVAGYEQSFIERAVEGSTWSGYFAAQDHPWFQQAMAWRLLCGFITLAGLGLLIWDLLIIGKDETRPALKLSEAD